MSEEQGRLGQMRTILEVAHDLTSTVALEPLLYKIINAAAELTDSEASSILLLDTHTGELRFRAATGSASQQLSDIPVPVEGSIAGQVLISGKPCLVTDTDAEPGHYKQVAKRTGVETKSLLAVPLHIKELSIGVLEVINKRGDAAFAQDDIEMLSALADQAAVAIENARLVTALQVACEQVSKLDRLKSDFIAIASHELRTPLALILGYASLLQENVGPDAARQMDVVVRAATKLKGIIETMLNLRYLETGQVELRRTCFDVREDVRETCDAYSTIAETHDLVIEANLPQEEALLWGDRECIHVILDNLVSNAVKFNKPGGQIVVGVYPRDKDIEVRVTDTGIGVRHDQLERIFDRFFQTEDHMRRRYGGIGLGLSIVKDLVELHGGRVWAESTPGHGSRFFVVLPRGTPTS